MGDGAWAGSPTADPALIRGLGRYARRPDVGRLREAVRDGLAAPAVRRPAPERAVGVRLSPAARARARKRLVGLKAWRAGLGSRLGLDPALLWPAAGLERLSTDPDSLDVEVAAPQVRRWQRREFEGSLRRLLQSET